MSAAVCPACGVTVVPGYVRCPKCRAALSVARRAIAEGGTAVPAGNRFPILPVLVAVGVAAAVATIGFFGLRHDAAPAARPPAPRVASAPTRASPGPAADTPSSAAPAQPSATRAPEAPDPDVLADHLQRALQHRELWSTVEVVGDHVDVRSSSCNDPKMKPMLAPSEQGFRAAGLTELRCLEQSGAVVFTREL